LPAAWNARCASGLSQVDNPGTLLNVPERGGTSPCLPVCDLVLRFINTATYPFVALGAKGRSGGFLAAGGHSKGGHSYIELYVEECPPPQLRSVPPKGANCGERNRQRAGEGRERFLRGSRPQAPGSGRGNAPGHRPDTRPYLRDAALRRNGEKLKPKSY